MIYGSKIDYKLKELWINFMLEHKIYIEFYS